MSRNFYYTHRVSYQTKHPRLGTVDGTFRTTADALKHHLEQMNRGGLCFNIRVERI